MNLYTYAIEFYPGLLATKQYYAESVLESFQQLRKDINVEKEIRRQARNRGMYDAKDTAYQDVTCYYLLSVTNNIGEF